MPHLFSRGTYKPFGSEVGTSGSATDYKFTGKERDGETDFDYFGARYYISAHGRWLTPDWSAAPVAVPYADMSHPQSLNLYGYVRNRPTFQTDSDGHCGDDIPNYSKAPGGDPTAKVSAETRVIECKLLGRLRIKMVSRELEFYRLPWAKRRVTGTSEAIRPLARYA